MTLKKHIGRRIRTARKQAGLTQMELAERLQKSVDTISNLERGSSLTSLETLSEVASAVDVPLSFLFLALPHARAPSDRRVQLIENMNAEALRLDEAELELAVRIVAAIRAR